MAKAKTAKIQAKSTEALATPRASPRVKAKITKAESKKKELFKDSAGKLVDLSEWVDTEAFDMALYSINRQHPELDIGAVLNYRESRLQEFADSKDFEIINVRGVWILRCPRTPCFGTSALFTSGVVISAGAPEGRWCCHCIRDQFPKFFCDAGREE